MNNTSENIFWMNLALEEAKKAYSLEEIPVGAVIVFEGEALSCAHNSTIALNDPTAHAEVLALRDAAKKIGNYRLKGCVLYVTLEPCAMCLGASIHARLEKLIYGALDPKSGAVESIMRFPFEKTNHKMEIKGGILSEECGKILKDFFKQKRGF